MQKAQNGWALHAIHCIRTGHNLWPELSLSSALAIYVHWYPCAAVLQTHTLLVASTRNAIFMQIYNNKLLLLLNCEFNGMDRILA